MFEVSRRQQAKLADGRLERVVSGMYGNQRLPPLMIFLPALCAQGCDIEFLDV